MTQSNPFGTRSTADQVLAGIDLTGKRIVITGCDSGLGFETMSALTANGAHVIGLARTLQAATSACDSVNPSSALPSSTPIACDLADFESVAAAAAAIRALNVPLDAIVTNAGIAHLPELATRYGVEHQFLVNHLGHFALVNSLLDLVRSGTGRVVIVSSSAAGSRAPAEGIMFDNLDGDRFYDPSVFYSQSKLANALYAKELSRRLAGRGIAVNSLNPGATKGTGLNRHLNLPSRILLSALRLFRKTASRAAATQTLLAASPRVSGITGEYWADCEITAGSPLLQDAGLARRLWEVSQDILARHAAPEARPLQQAA